jgi:hypothetical protein
LPAARAAPIHADKETAIDRHALAIDVELHFTNINTSVALTPAVNAPFKNLAGQIGREGHAGG